MANPLLDIFRIRDLRDRILFTVMVLVIFRIGAFLPIPGIDVGTVKNFYAAQQSGGIGITDYFDFFSGGAFTNFSVFMLGIVPYITTSIMMQLLVLVFPKLKKISQEDGGRKRIQRYTRIATVGVCIIQSLTVTTFAGQIPGAIIMDRIPFTLLATVTVTAGTIFLMWLGEQITQRGIGNGISLLIFAGIVARIPDAIYLMINQVQRGDLNPVFFVLVLGAFIGVISLVIYEQQGQRRIPVNYAKRVIGRKVYGAQNAYLPFKINPSGVIPVIFASSVLIFPLQIAQNLGGDLPWLSRFAGWLTPNGLPYMLFYALLIVFFAYFYTQVTLNPVEISKQIRENGGSIRGISSDMMTEYLTRVLNRIILPGALFLAVIAIIPSVIQALFRFPSSVAFLMGGTSLLIMVGVDLDTMSQIEGHLKMHHHDGIVRKGRVRARNL